jgi:tetratricopeptide (TPR) repeat protein
MSVFMSLKRGALLAITALLLMRLVSLGGALYQNAGYAALNSSRAQAQSLPSGAEPDYSLAASLFETAFEMRKTHSSVRGLGHIYALQGNETHAAEMWAIADASIDMTAELYRWGSVSERRGDRAAALQWYERAIVLKPDLADGWYHVGRLLQNAGDTATAARYYRHSLEAAQFQNVGLSDAALSLGAISHAQENWLEAQILFNLAIEKSDFRYANRAWQAYYLRGETRRFLNEPHLALLDYQTGVQLNPNHYWGPLRLAQMIWLVESDMAQAETLLWQAIAIDPARKYAYSVLGDLYRQNNRNSAAEEMYRMALTIDPDDWSARHYLKELGSLEIQGVDKP